VIAQLPTVVDVAAHCQTPPGQVHWKGVSFDVAGASTPAGQSLAQSSIVAEHTAPVPHGCPVGSARSGRTPASPNGVALDSFAHCGPGLPVPEQATAAQEARSISDDNSRPGIA
jgi:hypothetical protein